MQHPAARERSQNKRRSFFVVMSPTRRSAGVGEGGEPSVNGEISPNGNDSIAKDDAAAVGGGMSTADDGTAIDQATKLPHSDEQRQQAATFASPTRPQQEANEFISDSHYLAQQSQGNWKYGNSAAHPNDLPPNVITAYSASGFYSQQPGQGQEQSQGGADTSHLHVANSLPLLPDSESYQQEAHQEYEHSEAADALGAAAKGDPDSSVAEYSQQADTSTGMIMDGDNDLSRNRKKAKVGSGRVAKACKPCSSKKRRCDGGRPECSVCRVLGSSCSYTTTGLKRGPPKGFRAGPKESLRAKLMRTLETTIRDLASQLGPEEANREILRISRERGLSGHADVSATDAALVVEALANSASADLGLTQRAIENSLNQQDDDSTFLDVSDRDDLTHQVSSSGLQLLRRTAAGAGSAGSPSGSSPGSSADCRRNEPTVVPISSLNIPGCRSLLQPARMDQLLGQCGTQHLPVSQNRAAGTVQPHLAVALDSAFQAPFVTPEESDTLFLNYWRGFHPYWPILYKAILEEIPPHEVTMRLDGLLLNAIYAIGSLGRVSSALDVKAEDRQESIRCSGELFAQAAERRLFATGLRPTVTAIQASFLLSVFAHGTGELSRAWSFCGIAINMATNLGLHRWPIHRLDLLDNSVERETRTRTIWSLYILDKILCAEMGRAPILRAREIDPPLLSEDTSDEIEYMNGDPNKPLRISSVFNAAVNCFAILERILSEVHSLRRKAVLRRGETTPEFLQEFDEELEKFRRNIPEQIQIPADGSLSRVGFPGIVWALGMWDATATILLHRPFIPQQGEGKCPSYDEVVNNASHQKASAAADRLCELLQLDVRSKPSGCDVALWPSNYAYCLFTAAVMYIFNARLGIPGAHHKFALARDQIKRLSSRWPKASLHRQFLDGFTAVAENALGKSETTGGEPTVFSGGAGSIEEWTAQTAQTAAQAKTSQQFNPGSENVSTSNLQRSLPGLNDKQRKQLLGFYMDFSHRFGQTASDTSRRQLDSFAPGLFDLETVFWNESSSILANALATQDRDSICEELGVQGQIQRADTASDVNSQQHHGLAMLAALAPHAAPHQQNQQPGSGLCEQGRHVDEQEQQCDSQDQTIEDPNADPSHPKAGQQSQAPPFAFNLDPTQPAWTDPLMCTLDLGPIYRQ